MEKDKADTLIKKYLKGEATPEEEALLESWYIEMAEKQPELPGEVNYEEVENEILGVLREQQIRPVKRLWLRMAVAASVLLVTSFGYFLLRRPAEQHFSQNILTKAVIIPGGNRAILTLANGQKISLTNALNGKLATDNHATISKTADGQVAYSASSSEKPVTVAYNTMSTPRGGQYALTLSDGTKVILNATSSIRYPTEFCGAERRVELTGEAYFEVAHNEAMPFHVVTKQQDVQVLGTHFNINSYNDEPGTKTTLLQGSVIINGEVLLKPGEQAASIGERIKVNQADLEVATAWIHNKFMFDNQSIKGIMRMVARWYDVEVVYTDSMPEDKLYGGSVSRFENIADVLGILELTGNVHFKTEGRRIIVKR